MTILIISKAIEDAERPRSWHRMYVNGHKKADFCYYVDGELDPQTIAQIGHGVLEEEAEGISQLL
jgi:hypothetical protein